MNFLIRLKPWHLFLLVFVPMIFSSVDYIGSYLTAMSYLVYFGWMYSIGFKMHSLIPKHLAPKILLFKIGCVALTLCISASIILKNVGIDLLAESNFYWFVALCIVNFSFGFYVFSFASRMLESAIKGKIIGLGDSLIGFFGFWFFPIGLWYIQPAVHRVLNNLSSDTARIPIGE